ncbi:hypothetical protein PCASD_21900 [Puccinia coronata f. sp. avenae]|uniref:Uncharacterized protein n=1 Tax=Puccinia coronata f. sp. avenae TaxID=200324 RepID=A0A2N5SL57_9BASI|nr:hypothetical protein PCASD_21900 [Puccinia coronata f. sp. avenae]
MACSFASLQTEVADLKGDVAVFKADVVVLKADVASISSHLATIATSIQSMQAALTRISQAAAIKINIYLQCNPNSSTTNFYLAFNHSPITPSEH